MPDTRTPGYFDLAATGSSTMSAAGRAGTLPASGGGGFLGLGAGGWLQAGGVLLSSIGAFYQAQAQKDQLKSEALSLEHAANISAINARVAESDARAIEEAGAREADQMALRYAQEKGGYRAGVGGSGVVVGRGNAAEVAASIDYAAEVDALTISSNAVRAAGQRRMEAQDIRNRGALSRVSAENTRRTAGTIRPGVAARSSLIAGAGNFLAQDNRTRVR